MNDSPCVICAQTDYETLARYPGFDGVRLAECRRCGLMQAQPIPSDKFLAEFYNSEFGNDPLCGFTMNEKSEKGFRLRATLQFDSLKKIFHVGSANDKKVLDVGCHAASFLSLFKKRGWKVQGIDPNPRSGFAETWYGIRVEQKMFTEGLYEADSFDGILHSHVLEHVADPKAVLVEFHRLLKSGGWVFIEVPNESRVTVTAGVGVKPHLYFFTAATLKKLAEAAGFEVVATRVLGIGRRFRGPWCGREGRRWLRLRWQARYDALGRLNLLTFLPLFGRIFKEDRYFKEPNPEGVMLRAYLKKPVAADVS